MKMLMLIIGAALLFVGVGQAKTLSNELVLETNEGDVKTVKLKVTGMTCGGCSNTIHLALKKKDGIIEDEVKFPGDLAIIKYDPNKITEKEIIKVIEKKGFKAEVLKDDEKKKSNVE